jgi:acetyl coenzyme A synthetase (ADP forming)-like protein
MMKAVDIVLPERVRSLRSFFSPGGVAVIGASRDPQKLGYGILRNLIRQDSAYPGAVYPVNPRAEQIFGLPCYRDIAAVPDPLELAVLVVPTVQVLTTLQACGQRGIKAVVVISGGFRETGSKGAALEKQLAETANQYGIRLMGPNGIGVIDTHTPLNTTFARGMPARGDIAFISQSGALCGGLIDWIIGRGIGVSRFLSIGNEADVTETDVIQYLGADKVSRVIAMYLEDVKGGFGFVDALRQTTRRKPVLVIKTGRTRSGQLATASHTGALAGAHQAFQAACRQAGAIEVDNIELLFNAAIGLAYQPLPQGKRVAILTNAGGPAALATDRLESQGLELAFTSRTTQESLSQFLPENASLSGPVDMLGSANQHDYRRALENLLADPANDAILVIMVPPLQIDPQAIVEAMAAATQTKGNNKPLVACLMGEDSLQAANRVAHQHRVPAYTFPEECVKVLGILWQRSQWLRKDKSKHTFLPLGDMKSRHPAIQNMLDRTQQAGKTSISLSESQAILKAYEIPSPPSRLATSPDEALEFARAIGYPVVLKLVSPQFSHKSDVGGVILGVNDEIAVREGYNTILARASSANPGFQLSGIQVQKMVTGGLEVILGVNRDPTFGAVVMFGLGGIFVETIAQVGYRLAPFDQREADELVREVQLSGLLDGLHGAMPADREALLKAMVNVAQLADDFPQISELDINPLLVLPQGQGVQAADIRMIITAV